MPKGSLKKKHFFVTNVKLPLKKFKKCSKWLEKNFETWLFFVTNTGLQTPLPPLFVTFVTKKFFLRLP